MIVSWNWLKQYVALDMSADELVRRLMMSGLNHESTVEVGGDLAIDLEVTSNRPDCLGHIGIAREVAALWNRPLNLPAANPRAVGPAAAEFVAVETECPDLCPLYIARVVRNVKVGPSPWWLVRRLKTLGQDSVNNVVDITNYVLFECGQPLHVFDLDRLEGRRIVVRNARPGEKLDAINHKSYALEPWMCVIADAVKPVALAGVMGGAGSETVETSRNLVIEAADFAPLAVRNASRHLKLRSDSSYRFERRVDSTATDWASRRCCELILDLAGGELAAGAVTVGSAKPPVPPVSLRYSQLKRVLGIDVPAEKVREILLGLGAREVGTASERITVDPPSWRRDLTREIDLIEEVARIHGYEAIPEDVAVPMTAAVRSPRDRVVNTVRQTLSAVGFDECITLSVVEPEVAAAFAPWSSAPPLRAQQPVLRRADTLRQSLIPSLLAARRTNESLGNETIELFEIAKAYLPEAGELPREPLLVGLASGRDFFAVKGAVEAVAARLNPKLPVVVRDTTWPLLHDERSVELWWGDRRLGLLGETSQAGQDRFELRKPCTVAELHLDVLLAGANLTPRYEPLSDFPTGSRDLNFVVAETVRWSELEALARKHGGPHLESVRFRETYRGKQLGDRKSILFGLVFRSKQGTLVTTEIDAACKAIASAVQGELGGELRTA